MHYLFVANIKILLWYIEKYAFPFPLVTYNIILICLKIDILTVHHFVLRTKVQNQ